MDNHSHCPFLHCMYRLYMSLCTCLFTTLTATSRDPFSCKVFIHPFRHCQTSPTKKWTSSWFYELSLAFFISLPKLVSSLIIWRRHTMTLHKILNLIIILIVLYTLSTLLLFPLPVFVCSFINITFKVFNDAYIYNQSDPKPTIKAPVKVKTPNPTKSPEPPQKDDETLILNINTLQD